MSEVKFSKDHEWLRLEGETATVGITAYAQEQLGDLVYVELPALGSEVKKGAEAAVVESVKAASDVYAPVSGQVSAVNEKLASEPGLVNSDPMGNGWLFKIKIADASELEGLMDEAAYKTLLG
jgi:glycine cleavage system H protein